MTLRLAGAVVLLAASLAAAAPHPSPSPSPKGRVYTEEDLKKSRGNVQGGVIAGLPSPSPAPSGSPASTEFTPRELWRARAEERRRAIADAEKKLQEAQAALDGLGALPPAAQAPTGQDPIVEHQNRVRDARAAVDKAREAVTAARKSLDDLEEEARKKQIPPGWLRD